MASLGQLVAGIAHEINIPGAIKTSAIIMADNNMKVMNDFCPSPSA
jgi:C4-dicarboxylate-specific signal transduction histidine kinase